MKKIYLSLCLFFFVNFLFAQSNLLPSIGLGEIPSDEDSICEIPLYLESFETSGYQEGDLVADFNLYTISDMEKELSQLMEDGKPVLIIGGNYTCPVFRNKVPIINEIVDIYSNDLNVLIVYSVEAHPIDDISPYFGFENVTNSNLQNNILYEQPKTYGERKAIISDMLNAINIEATVLIDGPCNEWWANFGPAPNNAYLIDSEGIVFSKHAWFHKYPEDMICDIDALLGISNECGEYANGSFEFFMTGDTIVYGDAGSTLFVYGMLENNSNTGVEIEISRLQENIPTDWASSMCIDVCYSADVSYTTIFLEPGESKLYTMYFYTSENPGEGNIRMGFRNVNDLQNKYIQRMHASTMTTDLAEVLDFEYSISIFPNPAKTLATFAVKEDLLFKNGALEFRLFDAFGNQIRTENVKSTQTILDVKELDAGIYFYALFGEKGVRSKGKLVIK